jgi:hypothetical protein
MAAPDMYETLLAEYSNHEMAMLLLQQHRPYMEMVPSIRRSRESIMTWLICSVTQSGKSKWVAKLLC